ncbi:MAG: dockerin type I repeat-containing protein, partial [Prevotella sp.]|nr:dockerin type I repeat-containing protein [Prevotella sp.]
FWNSFGLSVTEQVPFKVVEGIHGDVNCDGGVDVADIATIIDVMAGNADEFAEHADVNGDGAVDVADIAEVISIMAELARKAKMMLEETE